MNMPRCDVGMDILDPKVESGTEETCFCFCLASTQNETGSSLAPSRWEIELRRVGLWIRHEVVHV